jgi:hypothetical protein
MTETGWEKVMTPELLAKAHPWGISNFQNEFCCLEAAEIIVRDVVRSQLQVVISSGPYIR